MAGTRHTKKSGEKHSCTRKRRHNDRYSAERAISYRVAGGAAEDRLTPYQCRFCGGWHVGNTPALKFDSRR